jgi:hypothetical protein
MRDTPLHGPTIVDGEDDPIENHHLFAGRGEKSFSDSLRWNRG